MHNNNSKKKLWKNESKNRYYIIEYYTLYITILNLKNYLLQSIYRTTLHKFYEIVIYSSINIFFYRKYNDKYSSITLIIKVLKKKKFFYKKLTNLKK